MTMQTRNFRTLRSIIFAKMKKFAKPCQWDFAIFIQPCPAKFVSALHVLVSSESRNIKNIFVILQLWVKEYQKYLCYFTALTRNIKNIFVILQLWVKECQKYLCKFAALSQRILQIFLWFYKSSQIRYVCELGVIKRTNIGDTNLQRLYLSIYLLLIP